MKMLRITQCSDALLWYRDLVGQLVPLRAVLGDCYASREPAGYTNFVNLQDAVVEEVPDEAQPQS